MKKIFFAMLAAAMLAGGCSGFKLTNAEVKAGPDGMEQAAVGGVIEVGDSTAEITIEAAPGETPHVTVDSPVIPAVHFDFDSSVIREDEMLRLLLAAEVLRKFDKVTLVIAGHCDDRGTREYNQALGLRRAKSVKNYLIALGVPAQRLSVVSYGKEQPVCTDMSEACRQKNRRAKFAIGN